MHRYRLNIDKLDPWTWVRKKWGFHNAENHVELSTCSIQVILSASEERQLPDFSPELTALLPTNHASHQELKSHGKESKIFIILSVNSEGTFIEKVPYWMSYIRWRQTWMVTCFLVDHVGGHDTTQISVYCSQHCLCKRSVVQVQHTGPAELCVPGYRLVLYRPDYFLV